MGIPLTGNINSFQTKLEAKGCKIDNFYNRYASAGTRIFKGQFAGNDARIIVSYNNKDKNVYRAKVVIEYTNKDLFNQKEYELAGMLREKYSSMYINSDDYGFSIHVTNNLGTVYLGHIDIFDDTQDPSYYNNYETTYAIHIDYWDAINSEKNDDDRMEDL